MNEQTNSLNPEILVRAILKDATGYMETIGPEDLPCNEQHEHCLAIISRAFDAEELCSQALELLRRWEAAVKDDTQVDTDGLTVDLKEPLSPNSVTLEFFKAALTLEDADERMALYNMADYIGEAVELLHGARPQLRR